MARAYYPSTWEVGEEGLGGQGYLQLHNKFETSLSCVSKQTKDRKKGRKGMREGRKERKKREKYMRQTDRHRSRCFESLLCTFIRVPSNGIHTRD